MKIAYLDNNTSAKPTETIFKGMLPFLKDEFASIKKVTCGIAWKSKNEDVGIEKSLALEDLLPILKIKDIKDYKNKDYF